MKQVAGKEISTTVREIVGPEHTALVLVDCQNDFCHPEGLKQTQQWADNSDMQMAIPRAASLSETARAAGVLVIYLQNTLMKGCIGDSPPMIRLRGRAYGDLREPDYCLDGTWGHQIVADLRPAPNEVIIKKGRPTGFLRTRLDQVLRSQGVKSVVSTGVTSEGCVQATAMDALFHDYYSVVVEDCVASYSRERHQTALEYLSQRMDVIGSDLLADLWATTRATDASDPSVSRSITDVGT